MSITLSVNEQICQAMGWDIVAYGIGVPPERDRDLWYEYKTNNNQQCVTPLFDCVIFASSCLMRYWQAKGGAIELYFEEQDDMPVLWHARCRLDGRLGEASGPSQERALACAALACLTEVRGPL